MLDYLEQVKADIKEWVEDNSYYIPYNDFESVGDFEDYLNDTLWCADSVTGNASGSYTFNSYKAREHVLNDPDTVRDALREFCVEPQKIADAFLDEEWEYLDVTARCYVLGQAIGEIVSENEDEITAEIEEAHE